MSWPSIEDTVAVVDLFAMFRKTGRKVGRKDCVQGLIKANFSGRLAAQDRKVKVKVKVKVEARYKWINWNIPLQDPKHRCNLSV